jgi:type IV pilus assembly protein PilQ
MSHEQRYPISSNPMARIWALLAVLICLLPALGLGEQSPAQEPLLQDRLKRRISVEFRRTPIEDVIRSLAEQADVDIVASPKVQGEVTVKLTDVSLEEVLRSILDVHGADFVAGENIVRILPRADMPQAAAERIATEIFEITYVDPEQVAKSLEKVKSEKGSISYMKGTSHIIVSDTESKLRDIASFVNSIDRITAQILVEARIYDITTKDRIDLGVQWDAGTRTTFDASGNPVGRTEPFGGVSFNGTTSKATDTTAGIRFGWFDSSLDLDMLLKAEHDNVRAKLLANPRILVLDNESATIKIVSQIPYQELTQSSYGGTMGTTSFKDVGVELQVTPHIAVRDNMVRLKLRPIFSVVTGQVQFSGTVSYPQPIVDKRETETTLIVQDGHTVVLGGMRKKEVSKQVNKMPLMGDIPLIGALFRFNGEETVNSELVVFVTPKIIRQPIMTEEEKKAHAETDFKAPAPAYTDIEKAQSQANAD